MRGAGRATLKRLPQGCQRKPLPVEDIPWGSKFYMHFGRKLNYNTALTKAREGERVGCAGSWHQGPNQLVTWIDLSAQNSFHQYIFEAPVDDSSTRIFFLNMRNWLLVESWAKDRRAGLSHVFVSDPLRARLLGYARKHPRFSRYLAEATALLKQPEHGEPHDDHFHVRIECPKEQHDICRSESRSERSVLGGS